MGLARRFASNACSSIQVQSAVTSLAINEKSGQKVVPEEGPLQWLLHL